MQVEKLRSLIRESINEYIKEIDIAAEGAAMNARVVKCEEAIQERETKLETIAESDHKDLIDDSKIKNIENEIKVLKKAKAKFEKQREKMQNKKDKKENPKKEMTTDAPVEEADVTAEMGMDMSDKPKEEALNESFLKMQKLAGVITESQYNQKKKALVENQVNEIFGFGKDYSKDPGVIYTKKRIDKWVNDKQLTPDEGKKLLSKMTEWVKQYEKDHKIPDFFKLQPPTDDEQSGSADAIYLAMKDFIKKIAPNSKLNSSSQPGTPHDEDGQNYVGR